MKVIHKDMPVCTPCWDKKEGPRIPTTIQPAEKEQCIVCDEPTTSGIYVRMAVTWL